MQISSFTLELSSNQLYCKLQLNIFKINIYKWIILLLRFMSLTVALSEREQNLLTHANHA